MLSPWLDPLFIVCSEGVFGEKHCVGPRVSFLSCGFADMDKLVKLASQCYRGE